MKKKQKIVFTIYRDKSRQWRWHAKRVGRIIAESGESYLRQGSCRKTLDHFLSTIANFDYTLVHAE